MISPIFDIPSPNMMSNSARFERRRHLVLYDLYLGARSELLLAVLYDRRASYVYTYAGIEFQRITAGRGLGIAVYHAYLVAQLVDEYADGLGRGGGAVRVWRGAAGGGRRPNPFSWGPPVPLRSGLRRQSRHRVYDDDVYGARSDKRIGYFERLLAVVGLRY